MTKNNQRQSELTNEGSPREPISRIKLFPVEVAIWKNHSTEGEASYAVTFARMYRDREGKWKSSTSFNTVELLILAKAADLAHSKIVELRAADKQPNEPEV